jgi:hypothetical protein
MIVIEETEMIVKEETNDANVASCFYLGSKVKLTGIPTAKYQHKLGRHQFASRLFNLEFNLISDWVLEHKPQKLSKKIYKRCTKKTLHFLFQEDTKFDLVGLGWH